jgi:hypothetical protein
MQKCLLFLFLIVFACPLYINAQVKDVPTVKLFDKEYFKYVVKPKETVFSLCKRFDVTEAELLSMNPTIVEGLKSGQTLLIPIHKSKEITTDKPNLTPDTSVETVSKPEKPKNTIYISTDKPRITLLLPFAPNNLPGANERYVEFYEGLLLAVDSLKTLGLSFEVQAIESGYDTETLSKILSSDKLDETDYCIGGVTSEQITLLADWAKKNQRYLIFPFSSRIPEMEKNPFLFQTNTPHTYIYNRLAEYASSNSKGSNVIFLKSGTDEKEQHSPLIEKVKSKLREKGLSFIEVSDDEQLEGLSKVLSTNKLNQIMPTPLSIQEANNLLTRLGAFHKDHPDIPMNLVGYPDWMTIGKTYQKFLYDLNTIIYSNFYADEQQNNVRDFQILFNQTYRKNLLNTYPKYGMMGYDIASFFIPRMVFEKSQIREQVPRIQPLQNDFKFGTSSPLSGASNQCIYIIQFTSTNEVKVKLLNE